MKTSTDDSSGGLIGGRHDPAPDVPANKKNRFLNHIKQWLGEEWLDECGPQSVRKIWQRRDWIATTELLWLGYSIEKLREKATESFIRRAAKTVKLEDEGNYAGVLAEIISAAMFDLGGQFVEMAPSSNPGYDYMITLENGKKLRVSCKALIPSAIEREFKKVSECIRKTITNRLANGSSFGFWAWLWDRNNPKWQNHEFVVNELFSQFPNGLIGCEDIIKLKECDWTFRVGDLVPHYKNASFWKKRISHTFMATSIYDHSEQRRFENKINEAVENLGKHCREVTENEANVIFIKIPESISYKDLVSWLNDFWDKDNKHISAILTFRACIGFIEGDDRNSNLIYMLSSEPNPKASIKFKNVIRDTFLKYEIPFGKHSNTVVETELWQDGNTADVSSLYRYMKGHHYYLFEKDQNWEFIGRHQNIEETIIKVFTDGREMQLDIPWPTTDELILV